MGKQIRPVRDVLLIVLSDSNSLKLRCVQYFDGIATFEEISYRTGLPKREIDRLLEMYKEDVSACSFLVKRSMR